MREKIKKAVKDPLFLQLCLYAVAMAALAVINIIAHGKPELSYLLQLIYAAYALLLFFFVKTLIKLWLKYFREKKERKESKLRKKLRAVWNRVDERIRRVFNLKPRGMFFGGEDTEYDLTDDNSAYRERKNGAARIKWSALRENREKVRYLYAARVAASISDGAYITVSDTARQVEKKLSSNERDELLFELYEDVRYTNHNRRIDDGEISYLCEKENIKKKKR